MEQHSKFLLHTLQVLYMCTLCDSTNINTIIEFLQKRWYHVNGDGVNGGSDSYPHFRDTRGKRYVTKPWSVVLLNRKHIYSYLRCIVYDKLLKPRQSFSKNPVYTNIILLSPSFITQRDIFFLI